MSSTLPPVAPSIADAATPDRSALTATILVEIIDSLVDDFDVNDVLRSLTARCVELLGAAAAGILLADDAGSLQVISASDDQAHLLALLQLHTNVGPCVESFRTGLAVCNCRLDLPSPWPAFAAESVRSGFPSVCAIPLRQREVTVGCLNLFMDVAEPLSDPDMALARAFADVAAIVILQDHATRQSALRERQLQHALTSRIVIEQAKGMLAEHCHIDVDQAFARLRSFARSHNRGLTEVAESLRSGTLDVEVVASGRRPVSPRPRTNPSVDQDASPAIS